MRTNVKNFHYMIHNFAGNVFLVLIIEPTINNGHTEIQIELFNYRFLYIHNNSRSRVDKSDSY